MKRKPRPFSIKLLLPIELVLACLIAGTIGAAYYLFATNVATSANQNFLATGEQLLSTYDSYFSGVFRNSEVLVTRYNEATKDEATCASSMEDSLLGLMALKEEMIGGAAYKASTGKLITKAGKGHFPTNAQEEKWFQSSTGTEADRLIPTLSLQENPLPAYPHAFTLSRYASNDRDENLDAVLRLDFSFSAIASSLSDTALGEGSHFVIYDKEYREVYSSDPANFEGKKSILSRLVAGSSDFTLSGHRYFVYASSISSTSWRLGVFLNRDATQKAIQTFGLTIGLTGLALFLVAGFACFWLSSRAIRPVSALSHQMAQIVSLEDMPSLRLPITGSKEVMELDASFQAMISRIEELTQSIIVEKEEQRKSELLALQNQINPHFLYNTLDSILALIDKKENDKAEEMVVALSRFFRISISRGQNIIPLSKEIEHAKNYLLIQKLRFGDAFDYEFDVDAGLLAMNVVKLILQPIIENSINHGLKEGQKGTIRVRGYRDSGFVRLDISDDGYGMSPKKKQELEQSLREQTPAQGVGLKNVYLRLKVYYGSKADVTISSQLDVGTTVSLWIPEKGGKQ